MSLHYLVKLEMLTARMLLLAVPERNSIIYSSSAVAPKFAGFESS